MNILVIDDEKTILHTVYTQLKEMNLDINEIDVANSAKEARKCMKKKYYDIFLCDIVMPEEDGISFAKWVLIQYPDVKFVFLTAHADFGYMKEAISMQSFDYLLQPADRTELRKVVERAIVQIKLENRNRALLNRKSFLLNYEETILEEKAFLYCEGKLKDQAYINHLLASRGEKTSNSYYTPVLIEILQTHAVETNISKSKSLYQSIADEMIKPLPIKTVMIFNEEKQQLILLLCEAKNNVSQQHEIVDKLENCRIFFQKLLHTTVAIYSGESCLVEQLQKNCKPLFQLIKDNVRKESRVFRSQRSGSKIGYSAYDFESQMFSWKKLFDEKEFSKFHESLFQYIDHYSISNPLTIAYMIDLHQFVTKLILGYMVNNGIDSNQVFDNELPYLEYMQCWQDLTTFRNAIELIMHKLYELVGINKEDIVEKASSYIKHNMDKDLAVWEVAQHVGVNSEYLSKLFKKKTNKTLKTYIVNEKMKAAQKLLKTTKLSVTIIADHVGYGNYSNFTRTFKQLIGCTPIDYRNKCKKNED